MTAFFHGIATLTGGVGGPILFALAGLYLSAATGFVQIRRFPAAVSAVFCADAQGDGLSPRRALLISLGAVMGPGNLIGVAAAVAYGGPGAVFWMWLSGVIGMALRYAETSLAARYRALGGEGMMGVMTHGLHFRSLAVFFAFAGVLTSYLMADLTSAGVLAVSLESAVSVPPLLTAVLLSFAALPVIAGGKNRIAEVSPLLISGVTVLYLFLSVSIFFRAPKETADAVHTILASAFDFRGFTFGVLPAAVRHGIAKGIYSNECGIGSEPTISAACSSVAPARQGEIAMLGPFLDTVIFCGLSGILCVMSGESAPEKMLVTVFARFYPRFGAVFIITILILLVYTTVISWYFPGESFARYSFGEKWLSLYRAGYLLLPLTAPCLDLSVIYALCDTSVALMALPSLAAILFLSPEVIRLSQRR